MAWTDAARAAAAQARKHHSNAKKYFGAQDRFNISALTSKSERRIMANQIKKVRSGTGRKGRAYVDGLVSHAAASTRLRNLVKK